MIVTGPAIHLWVLPFAFCAVLRCRLADRHIPKGVPGFLTLLAVFLVVLSCTAYLCRPGPPFEQWAIGMPGVVLVVLAIYSPFMSMGLTKGTLGYVLGLLLTVACLYFPLPSTPTTRLLARLSIGIYLLHPMMFIMVGKLAPGLPVASVGGALAAFLLSAAVSASMLQIPGLRRIV